MLRRKRSRYSRSKKLFAAASRILPGGVDSPVRAFKAVGGTPVFVARARGAHIVDVDGNTYVDYVMSWGPLIHGHAPKGLRKALAAAAANGTSFGAPTELETALAQRVARIMPSIERIRFVSSGTEAAMSAMRVARAATGCDRIVKFAGCYHGHADAFLVQAGSGAMTLGVPTSPGVSSGAARDTLLARYNDLQSVEALFSQNPKQIAAVFVEPIAGNMGVVTPKPGFLEGLRALCDREHALLVFDEVISGFRAAMGGAQAVAKIRPDLTCLGKIIGGGLPVGAYGGRAEIMDLVAPAGPVYQAGTLSGNPLAMTAGLWSLGELSPKLYRHLTNLGGMLAAGLADAARDAGVPLEVNGFGSILTPFFTSQPVVDFESALKCDTPAYGRFFHAMLDRGIYPPPSQFEAWFLSAAHTERDVKATIDAARAAMRIVRAGATESRDDN
jgi:glutamate-1-semialdehyde 2,1-aminomutase